MAFFPDIAMIARQRTIESEEECEAESILRYCELEILTQAEQVGVSDVGTA